jgi:hypothetical protein
MTTNHDDDNEDDIDEIEFDEESDIQDDLDLEAQEPPLTTANARRELEKRLEMKRLRELLDYTEFDDDF